MVRGYHKYKEIWSDPFVGEELPCELEVGNPHDPLVVAIKKILEGNTRSLATFHGEYLFCAQCLSGEVVT